MFHAPTPLDNLRNKEQQYQASLKMFREANTYPEIIRCFYLKKKQYHQYLEAKYNYEKNRETKINQAQNDL